MRRLSLHRAFLLVTVYAGVATLAAGQPAPSPDPVPRVTIDEALERALRLHPELALSEAEVRIAEGESLRANTPLYNPEVSADYGRASADGRRASDFDVAVEQVIELGGKRGKRVSVATARLEAARSRRGLARSQLVLRVRRAYMLAVIAGQRITAAHEAEAIAVELKSFADQRLELGAGTLLEVNVASAARGRAIAERLGAEQAMRTARAELAAAVGDPAVPELAPAAEAAFAAPVLSEDEFIRRALANRGDLMAAAAEIRAAEAELSLAQALAVPDVVARVGTALQGIDHERSASVGVSVSVPILNRNQGGQAVAQAVLDRARVAETVLRQAVERDARVAFTRYRAAREAQEAYDRNVVDKLAENLALAWESFRSGKIGLLEFNAVRRDLVDTRRAFLDALIEVVEARAAADAAAGGPWE
jgi:outer membrane protein, heavy metal efflux system